MKHPVELLCLLFCGGLLMFVPANHSQREIADKILRFHVIANSDSFEDQQLKIQVRDQILDFLREPLAKCESKEEYEAAVLEKLPEIEAKALDCVREQGYDYAVDAALTLQYFPEKTYGNMTFPRGIYRSLTVDIGSGQGRNWWCVLFPSLCFTDAVTAGVSEESQKTLEETLTPQAYETLLEGDHVQIRFKLWEMIEDLFLSAGRTEQ